MIRMTRMHKHGIQLPRRVKRRSRRTGTLPGSVVTHPEALPSKIEAVQFDAEQVTSTTIGSSDDLAQLTRNAGQVTWIDVAGLENAKLIEAIGRKYGLHPLALEDAVNVHQRAKVDMYGDHLFMVVRAHPRGGIDSEQIAMFLGTDFVITFQECTSDTLDAVRIRVQKDQGRIREHGADFLLYSLLDSVIDGFFPTLEDYGERLDNLDERISVSGERDLINQIHNVRVELLTLRRSVWPLREAINLLIRDSGTLIQDETDLYFRDCYDHVIQIIDVIESDRELCSDLRDFYLTVASNRMNQIMKFLTIIATLFIPLSFITGLYGMNFNTHVSDWNMPELNWVFGYPFAIVLMCVTAGTLTTVFWIRGWLG
ncbi:MAG: magnesium/cobalt transporter CorA [Rubripirellula sp.]